METAVDIEVVTWAQFLGLLLAPLMTYAVGYLTKASWPGKYKGALLLALSLVNGILVELFSPHPEGWDLRSALFRAVLAFVTAQTVYLAALKKTDSIAATQAKGIADKLAE